MRIPVVDLFAGAGGLGEGFSALQPAGTRVFDVRLSIDANLAACETLRLRAFYRTFAEDSIPEAYYKHLRGELSRAELFASYPQNAQEADRATWCVELGSKELSADEIDKRIHEAIANSDLWVLVGGPPCQAYSLAGRGRNRAKAGYRPEADHRHFLYLEYLRILKEHRPPVFLMENVKGILSSKVNGKSIFSRMIADLQDPDSAFNSEKTGAGYRIYSLCKPSRGFDLFGDSENSPSDYIVEGEKYGLPQRRHRVLLIGVRQDIHLDPSVLRPSSERPTTADAIGDLPRVRAGLSFRSTTPADRKSSDGRWHAIFSQILKEPWAAKSSELSPAFEKARRRVVDVIPGLRAPRAGQGAEVVPPQSESGPRFARDWYHDPRLKAVCNHSTRNHMESDFHRYLWAACYAEQNGASPHLKDFPKQLWPEHKNIKQALAHGHFSDRFKVQLKHEPSTTVMSHIAQDGHYYIHYDPSQCRSLTVREAARLQTFPDNYFFCGNRTEQYTQVGNAVPPLLSYQMAEIIHELLVKAELKNGRSDFKRTPKLEHVSNSIEKHRPRNGGPDSHARNGVALQTS